MLAQVITHEVLPRLILARGAVPSAAADFALSLDDDDVETLAEIILCRDLSEAVSFVDDLGARGMLLEAICLELLAPTARCLGTMWDDDMVDLCQVAIGLGRLHQVLGGLGCGFRDDACCSARRLRVLLVPAPGESHSFGMSMVSSFFQRAGWSGWCGVPASPADLLRRVRCDRFAVVGFSLSCRQRLHGLSEAIRAVRQASVNPDVRIMVGGALFIQYPELVAIVGADATAGDAGQAVLQAQKLLRLLPDRGLSRH